MSIQSEITLLNNTKEAIKDAIKSKGVMVASTDPFAIYPTRIGQISSTPGDKENLFKALVERTYTTLEVPYGTEVIRNFCFYDNDVVTSITLPETLKSIKKEAFYSCGSITSITIPANVTYIGEKAFQYCTSLTSITCLETVPATLAGTSIYVFDNTNNCPIYVPAESVDTYKAAWTRYASRIQAIQIPALKWVSSDGTQEISIACEDLVTSGTLEQTDRTAADTGNLMKTVEGSAEIGDCVTTIGSYAFAGCSALTSVTIPDSVTSIGDEAFGFCTSLTSITVNAMTPPTLDWYVFFDANECPIYVPSASYNTYLSSWSEYAGRIMVVGQAKWVVTSSVCETLPSGKYTGTVIRTTEDVNPTSPTYGESTTETVVDTTVCDPNRKFFKKVTSIDELETNGEANGSTCIVVNENTRRCLKASLISSTTSTSNGLNSSSNYTFVSINNGIIEATDSFITTNAFDYVYDDWNNANELKYGNYYIRDKYTRPNTYFEYQNPQQYGNEKMVVEINNNAFQFKNTNSSSGVNRYLGYTTKFAFEAASNSNMAIYKLIQ